MTEQNPSFPEDQPEPSSNLPDTSLDTSLTSSDVTDVPKKPVKTASSSAKYHKKKQAKAKSVAHKGRKGVAPVLSERSPDMNTWKIAAITLVVLFVIIVAFRNIMSGSFEPAGPEALPTAEDQDATAPVLADTSDDPEISLTVINDKSCPSCDTSQVLGVIQQQLFPTVKVKKLDYASAEAKKLVKDLDIQALPAYIFDAKVTEAANYDKVAPALIQKGDRYVVHPGAVGAGKYLNPPSADDDPVEGKKDAPVTIIEFSDFQCPFCGKFFKETLPKIREDYIKTGKAKLVYRDFPLDFHPFAQKAAEAAECADEQGKFWQMHDQIFENQNAIAVDDLKSYAKELSLDTAKFNSCLDSGKYEQEVKKDTDDGLSVGVSGTPAFFIDGNAIIGAQPFEAFKQVIDAELSK